MKLSDFDSTSIKTLLVELEGEATAFVRSCDASADIQSEYKVYMRYTGQGWEIPIALSKDNATNPVATEYLQLFEASYANLFGRTVEGMDVEITVWSVNATTPPGVIEQYLPVTDAGPADAQSKRSLYDSTRNRRSEADVFARESLNVGQTLSGPAVITEDETSIILPSSRRAIKQTDGCIDVTLSNDS